MRPLAGEEAVIIPAGEGTLEGGLLPGAGAGVGLVCHPHPLFGGDMDNKVVVHLCRALSALGMTVLRFNFRGVGASTGHYDEGRGEVEDVRQALSFLRAQGGGGPVAVAGYSFGAYCGLKAARALEAPTHLVGVAPPFEAMDFAFLEGEARPLLLLIGEEDPISTPQEARRRAEGLAGARVEVRAGADHLFHGCGPWIRERVGALLGG